MWRFISVIWRAANSWAAVQKEVATGAAVKIERFVQEIHNTLKGATKSREIAPKGLTTEFRFELEKLLLIAPAVTEALALDENGAIRVQASRLRTVLPEAKRDLSTAPPFLQAKQGKSYFGPVHFVRGSEPYMTIAVPIERFAGDVIGVLQAEVNLKYIGDVVSAITVGRAGYAYAVTRTGELIAHPDISLVLQRRNVAVLEQVKSAFQARPGKARAECHRSRQYPRQKCAHLVRAHSWARLGSYYRAARRRSL